MSDGSRPRPRYFFHSAIQRLMVTLIAKRDAVL